MKKIFTLSFAILLAATFAFAQDGTTPVNNSKIKFDKTEHDFGKGPVGKPTTYEFKFKNIGTEPLVLSNVKASCGCTAPSWPKEPIMPGEGADIKVQYNMARAGAYRKSITVTTMGGETVVLYVSGDAISAEGAQGVDAPKPSIISNQ
jgi:hypothetical protein